MACAPIGSYAVPGNPVVAAKLNPGVVAKLTSVLCGTAVSEFHKDPDGLRC